MTSVVLMCIYSFRKMPKWKFIKIYAVFHLCLFIVCSEGRNAHNLTTEYRLIDDLFWSYDSRVRPVEFTGQVTPVRIEVSLFNILEMNTQEEILKTNSEIIMKWIDPKLMWDPLNYENITEIRIPYNKIWLPDIILYNTAEADYESAHLSTNAIVSYQGLIALITHSRLVSICSVDVEYYPFDEQKCQLRFASLTYDETEIRLIFGSADISDFRENPEFALENFYAHQFSMFNPCCEYPMSAITFHIQIQRRTHSSLLFFITPGIMINACAIFVFSLPAESESKMALGINSMVAMTVFLMAMTMYVPPTETIPLAGLYYGICLTLITANIGFSVIIMNVNVAGERKRRIPNWLRSLTLFLVRILKNRIPEVVGEKWGVHQKDHEMSLSSAVTTLPSSRQSSVTGNNSYMKAKHQKRKSILYGLTDDPFQRRMVQSLELIAQHMKDADSSSVQEEESFVLSEEWKFISRVFDRLLFYLFAIVAICLDLLVLTSSPFSEHFQYCPFQEDKCDEMTREEIMAAIKSK